MAIYRGPGGAGDATGDATNAASLAISKANEAAASATSAAASATAAAASATSVGASETAAATSATNASGSASTASTAATNASNSASAASTSASNAATSATAAASSASSASTSATNAATSASAATSSASAASTSATAASSSASSAASSATSAASSATTAASYVADQTGNAGKYLTTDGSAVSWANVSSDPSDGDKGDVTVSSSGTVWTIDNSTITDSKLNLSANASNIKTALNASGSAPIYACRAWVNFNGTGTVAIRASGNVSSITDNGTGDYTVNFTTAMPDANYCPTLAGSTGSSAGETYLCEGRGAIGAFSKTTSAYRINALSYNSASLADRSECNVAIFR